MHCMVNTFQLHKNNTKKISNYVVWKGKNNIHLIKVNENFVEEYNGNIFMEYTKQHPTERIVEISDVNERDPWLCIFGSQLANTTKNGKFKNGIIFIFFTVHGGGMDSEVRTNNCAKCVVSETRNIILLVQVDDEIGFDIWIINND